MKKILSLLLMLCATQLYATETEKVLFLGERNVGNWSASLKFEKATFANAKAGDVISVSGTTGSGDKHQLGLRFMNADWSLKPVDYMDVTAGLTYTLTADDATNLKTYGLAVQGVEFVVSKVSVISNDGAAGDATDNDIVLSEGSLPLDLGNWSSWVKLNPSQFNYAVAGDQLVLTLSGATSDCQIAFQDNNWSNILPEINIAEGTTTYTFTITSDYLSAFKSNNVIVKGKNATITAIVFHGHTGAATRNMVYNMNDKDEEYISQMPTTAIDVTLNRAFKQGWNSICLPFSLTQAQLQQIDAQAQVYTFSDYADKNVTFTRADETQGLTAGTPYLLYLSAANTGEIGFSGVTMTAATAGSVAHGNATFNGNYAAGNTAVAGNYGVTSDGYVEAGASDSYVDGYRAYIAVVNGAKVNTIGFDQPTGIASVQATAVSADAPVYSVSGMRMNTKALQRGLYIRNGKKYVVK